MSLKIEHVIVPLQIAFAFSFVICLWFKILLPYSYFSIVGIAAAFLTISVLKGMRRRYVLLQILMIYLLIGNVYGLATHYSVLPYGDSYWEYAVVKTFSQSGTVYTIPEQAASTKILTWYSGWPLIHTLALILSTMSGISPFYAILVLPLVVSLCSFFVIYLFLEKARAALLMDREVVYLGLLIFALSPDIIFWRTQFVRMSFGLLWFNLIIYLLYSFVSQHYHVARGRGIVIAILAAFTLVMTHHFVSFLAAAFLLLLFILTTFGKYLRSTKVARLVPSILDVQTVRITILLASFMFICEFLWWSSFGNVIWPTVTNGITRFINVITGVKEIEFYVPQPIYPVQLTPTWALVLLRIRDIVMLIPSLVGVLVFWIKKPRNPSAGFVLYAMIVFGLLFIVNGVTFKLEPFRLVTLAMPFIALLTASAYNQIKLKSSYLKNIALPAIIILIMLTSFLGLWAHSFAPMHLYNPAIEASEVGEHSDIGQLERFFYAEIPIDNLKFVWGDDLGPLILLLSPSHLDRIQRLTPENIQKMGAGSSELFCESSDLFLYKYYAGAYSPIRDPGEAKNFSQAIREHLSGKFNRIYDDGTSRLWKK